jgi:hypothetical protein
MEQLGKNQNTPGTDAAFDLLSRMAVDPETDDRYPNKTVLIPADSPYASDLMREAVAEGKPIAIVFPDGSDLVWRPPEAKGFSLHLSATLLWMADHVQPKRDRPTFIPRIWVNEFHSARRDKVAA